MQKMNYADIISSERTGRGWSMQQLAEKAHVSRSTIYKLEHGYSLSFAVLEAVLGALGLKIEIKRRDEVMRW